MPPRRKSRSGSPGASPGAASPPPGRPPPRRPAGPPGGAALLDRGPAVDEALCRPRRHLLVRRAGRLRDRGHGAARSGGGAARPDHGGDRHPLPPPAPRPPTAARPTNRPTWSGSGRRWPRCGGWRSTWWRRSPPPPPPGCSAVTDPLGRAETRALLDRHGIRLRRHLGQHFMVEPNVVRRIVEIAGVGAGSQVVEIGAGAGTLTRALAATGATVIAYEVDEGLRPVLAETVGDAAELRFTDPAAVDFGPALPGG